MEWRMINLQIARIYRNNTFLGYGIAVNGELLPEQMSTDIQTEPGQQALMSVVFRMTEKMVEGAVRVEV